MQNAGVKFNLLSKKGWFVNNDLSNQSYRGLTNALIKTIGCGMQL